jgi:23S rRNA (adenine2503-C2)-methyltransferase
LGARHICVSTSGPIRELEQFIEAETRTTLAISLHAPDQATREKLMPIARANSLDKLFQLLDKYVSLTNKKVSYEYILIDGLNDNSEQALLLASLLKNRLAFVNLIRFNPVPGMDFKRSKNIEEFQNILKKAGIPVAVRVSLGKEISAACGQLAGKKKEL